MRRRSQTRLVLKWGGLVLLLAIMLVWLAALAWHGLFLMNSGYYDMAVVDSNLILVVRTNLAVNPAWLMSDCGFRFQRQACYIGVPIWIPFLLIAAPTAFLWWHDRRRFPPGQCRRCGYNLTGNTSGVCPECGTAVPGRGADAAGRSREKDAGDA